MKLLLVILTILGILAFPASIIAGNSDKSAACNLDLDPSSGSLFNPVHPTQEYLGIECTINAAGIDTLSAGASRRQGNPIRKIWLSLQSGESIPLSLP